MRRSNRTRQPTMKDIAQKAQVSVGTVSNYINGTARVSESTAARIQNAIDQLDFHPNLLARSLKSQATHTLGLVLPNIVNPFFSEITQTINQQAWNLGYQTILCESNDDPNREAAQIKSLFQRRIDGALVIHTGSKPIDLINQWAIPTVFVDRYVENQPSFVTDNEYGGKLGMHHLVGLGHRQIAIIAGDPQIDNVQQRIAGAKSILDEYEIEIPSGYYLSGKQAIETGLLASKFWQEDNPPSAIYTTNDIIAIGVWQSCLMNNVRVPEDVSIIGFDNIVWSSQIVPPLTTISQPIEDICYGALEILLKVIQGEVISHEIREFVPELIVRDSTARP